MRLMKSQKVFSNFQALLEHHILSGEENLKKCFESMAINIFFCSKIQQKQMHKICDSYIVEETLREVRDKYLFPIITDDKVGIARERT
jgi:hypothetical protein